MRGLAAVQRVQASLHPSTHRASVAPTHVPPARAGTELSQLEVLLLLTVSLSPLCFPEAFERAALCKVKHVHLPAVPGHQKSITKPFLPVPHCILCLITYPAALELFKQPRSTLRTDPDALLYFFYRTQAKKKRGACHLYHSTYMHIDTHKRNGSLTGTRRWAGSWVNTVGCISCHGCTQKEWSKALK